MPNQDAFARRRDATGEADDVFATTTFRAFDFRAVDFRTTDFLTVDFRATDFFELALALTELAFSEPLASLDFEAFLAFAAFARASARVRTTKHRSKELLTRSLISSDD